ncbi:MAG: hypothetical protein ABGX26_01570 [Nautiliaceae bacterium]|jgi:hypothetical protein
MKKIILLLGIFYFAFATYTTTEAKSHIGEYAEKYAERFTKFIITKRGIFL